MSTVNRSRLAVAAGMVMVVIGVGVALAQLITAYLGVKSAMVDPYVVSVSLMIPFAFVGLGIVIGLIGLLRARKRNRKKGTAD